MNTNDTQTEAAEGGSRDLLAFSQILSGLLASGHFTLPQDNADEPDLIRTDFGKDWKEDYAYVAAVYRRHSPCVFEVAEELFNAAKDLCNQNHPSEQ